MKRYVAPRGTGDVGPAIPRADHVRLPREQTRRGRDDCSLFGTFAVARSCDRTLGEPGVFPLEAQVNRPARCDAYVLQAWMTVFAVEHPFTDSAGVFEPRCDLDLAESVLMAVAQEAPEDDEDFSAQRPVPQQAAEGALLGVSVDGKGVPMITAAVVTLKATLGRGAKRQTKKEALVGVSSTVDPTPRSPEALAERLVDPEAARARRQREDTSDDAPSAPQVRRLASVVRTTQAVMERIRADAERRDPQHRTPVVVRLDGALGLWSLVPQLFKPWTRVTCVLDIMPVVGDLWSAANALFGAPSKAGQPWVQQQLTTLLRGRVGAVIGSWRPILTTRQLRKSVRETLTKVITCFHNHRRWMPYDVYLAAGLPVGTGVVESACGAVVKPRMAGEGQRWSLKGAEAMLAWRSLKKSHDHDLRDDWRFRAHQGRARLSGRQPKYQPTARLRRVASLNSNRLRSRRIACSRSGSAESASAHTWGSTA